MRCVGAATAQASREVSTGDRLAELESNRAWDDDAVAQWEEASQVRTRSLVGLHEDSHTLGSDASRQAWQRAGCPKLDLLLACTSTPTGWGQALSAQVAQDLGLPPLLCSDLVSGPTAPLLGLAMAAALLPDGGHALLVGSDTCSRLQPGNDLLTFLRIADGAAALVLQVAPLHESVEGGLLGAYVATDSRLQGQWAVRGRLPPHSFAPRPGDFSASPPSQRAVAALPELAYAAAAGALEASGLDPSEVREVVVHAPPGADLAGALRDLGIGNLQPVSATADRGDWGCATTLAAWSAVKNEDQADGIRLWLATGPGLSAGAVLWHHT